MLHAAKASEGTISQEEGEEENPHNKTDSRENDDRRFIQGSIYVITIRRVARSGLLIPTGRFIPVLLLLILKTPVRSRAKQPPGDEVDRQSIAAFFFRGADCNY